MLEDKVFGSLGHIVLWVLVLSFHISENMTKSKLIKKLISGG